MGKLNICREIARQVVLAQIASDAGKGINELPTNSAAARKAQHFGYAVKDRHIQNAINLINKNPLCGFIYWVTKAPDQNGNMSKIIYFKYNQRQISFHSFGGGIIKTSINKGGKQRWDKSSSRKNCLLLIDEFNL